MTRAHHRRLAAVAVVALPLTGCLEIDGVGFVVDLAQRTGTLALRDIGAAGSDDLAADVASLRADYLEGTALEGQADHFGFAQWHVSARHVTPREGRLDGDVAFTFDSPHDLELWSWDAEHPTAWCPPAGWYVTRANASFRTREGCLVWARGVTTLRVEVAHARPDGFVGLRDAWLAANPTK